MRGQDTEDEEERKTNAAIEIEEVLELMGKTWTEVKMKARRI